MSRDQTDHEFLSVLQRQSPATIQSLCDSIGITATAVRQKLMRFQAAGLVDRKLSRQERGRPSYTYHLTAAGLKELGDDHAEIAAILWKQIMVISDENVRKSVLNGVKESLVERFGACRDGSSLASRLQLLTSQLAEQGFELEYASNSDTDGLPILREYNCPYHELAAEDPSICDLEQSVFSELLGVPVELSSCRLDGHRCCEFQVGE
ncbi:transcriptional regulator [Thalassoglobus sp. JC818]|uniref:helix-turn-helix transcriptional regulator n=1 Tax=Thalassoglobus sp. JC818 TaxID=3232136 RepID=UPI0034587F1C